MDFKEGLNDKQLEALEQVEGPVLIIAGAGSGKTRVLTHKIGYLIAELGIRPWNILAITFTNKAANEMKERVKDLIGDDGSLWIGTFHSICVKILRKTIDLIGFDSSFNIFDTIDQRAVIRRILKDKNLDAKEYTDRFIQYKISNWKNDMLTPEEAIVQKVGDKVEETVAEIYVEYQKRLKESNSLDFDDIINFTNKIFEENPEVLEKYAHKFQYILVDEYQDTNKGQFKLIKFLSSFHGNITVVGDNDQGIYAFRGADISNILDFEKDFRNAKVIKLEQNYRSTKNILEVANSVIKNNEAKYPKKLWTDNKEGRNTVIYLAKDEYDEARYIAKKIESLKYEYGYKYKDFAILYRMNTQSRAVEDILLREDIPYQVVGGLKFYERKEIKDAVAYLRLIHNLSDNISFLRIINEPKRGIGNTSIDKISMLSDSIGESMFEVLKKGKDYGIGAITEKAKSFLITIEELRELKDKLSLSEIYSLMLEKTGYVAALKAENDAQSENRIDNLGEFLNAIIEFENEEADPSLANFLETISLTSDIDDLEDEDDSVTLMTLHSSKGLEYPVVYIIGLEEGIFPSDKSILDNKEIEEERRLCYVGITRAKEQSYLTLARQRTVFGQTRFNLPSRFVNEIPAELVEGKEELSKDTYFAVDKEDSLGYRYGRDKYRTRSRGLEESEVSYIFQNKKAKTEYQFKSAEEFLKNITRSNVSNENIQTIDLSKFKKGVKVTHKKFGDGEITSSKPEGDDYILEIDFNKAGKKRLMAAFARLEIIGEENA